MRQVSIIAAENDWRTVPRSSINHRNKVVVAHLIFHCAADMLRFVSEALHQNCGGNKLHTTKAPGSALACVVGEHSTLLTLRPCIVTCRKWHTTVHSADACG